VIAAHIYGDRRNSLNVMNFKFGIIWIVFELSTPSCLKAGLITLVIAL